MGLMEYGARAESKAHASGQCACIIAAAAPRRHLPHCRPNDADVRDTDAAKPNASALALAREVIAIEAGAVAALADRIDGAFARAVELLLACDGRVVVTGIGKSGHIGRKLASTLASTGTPAMFVHAAEAAHGDLE